MILPLDGWERLVLRLKGKASLGVIALATALAAVVLVLAVAVAPAQTQSEQYFAETGHTVRGPFLVAFNSSGGLAFLGFPNTDEFFDAGAGRLVQYFQRARLEWHPENPEGSQVQLGNLNEEMGYARPPISANQIPAASDPNCQYFSATGHSVCNAFLTYYREHGGLSLFGYPIGEMTIESDRIVQYFQRAKMEWHPEMPAFHKVQLASIGSLAFDYQKIDRSYLQPKNPPNQLRAVTRLNVRASVKQAVTGREGSQTIYIFASDQLGTPLPGVAVTATLHLVSGDQTYTLPPTDSRGIAELVIPFGQTKPGGKVSIDVTATYNSLNGSTRTSFLPWW